MPTRYTSKEYANMHLIYGECRCNANLERYPDHRVFVNVHRSLTQCGRFTNQIRAGGRVRFPYEDEVLQEVADDPNSEYERMPPIFALDRYDTCLNDVDGLYCVVKLDLHAEPNNELMKLIKEYSAHTSKHYNHTYIERGVCVTRTCRQFAANENLTINEDLNEVLGACLYDAIQKEYKIEAKLSNIYYCDKHNEQTDVDINDYIVAVVFVILILLVVLGTFYDVFYCSTGEREITVQENKILLNFSLRKNYRELVNYKIFDQRYERLKGLNGLRSITTCLMIIAHVIFINSMGFIDSPHDFEKTYETFHYHLIYNGLMIVQIFFVMAAFLQAYNIQIRSETKPIKWSQLPKLFFARWCRLTPANAAMIAFSTTWLRHMGSGPLWKLYVTNTVVADCRRYWWMHILYLNNYCSDDTLCALQTWHVAADTQLFVIGIFVYLSTESRGRWLALALLLLVGMIAPALHVWLQDLDALVLMSPELYRRWFDRTFHYLHILGHNNLACYVIGLGTGTLVYYWHKKNVDLSKYKLSLA
ncbi:unnamed protein product [Parnassius apollo]|uniref:(apollo) hypothetical protein n=1 Tax=Parnassius apollo TaxID=110799 RepID=A0A8S3XFD0_PARAO|nr:unnamed protein product [Parnassius apollo]